MSSSDMRIPEVLPSEADVELIAQSRKTYPMSIFRVAPVEYKKFFCMATMFGIIAFLYSFLRITKDAIVSERQDPASIFFLKTWFVTPFSFGLVIVIQVCLKNTTVSRVFRNTLLVFGVYFLLYGCLLLPFQETVEFHKFWMRDIFSDGKMTFRGMGVLGAFGLTINFWTSSLLYVSSEIWGSLILSLLFMSFANDVCTFKQSMRFVPLFYIFSNFGLFFSGLLMYLLSEKYENGSYNFQKYLFIIVFIVSGALTLGLVAIQIYLEKYVLPFPIFILDGVDAPKKKKVKIGIMEGLKYAAKSKILGNLALMAFGYNICTNFSDSIFKSTMKVYAKSCNNDVTSTVMKSEALNQMAIAVIVILLMCTPFSRSVQKWGWGTVGFITPIVTIIACIAINSTAFYNTAVTKRNFIKSSHTWFGQDAVPRYYAEKVVGQFGTSSLKISKYAAFDIAKEAFCMRIEKDQRPLVKAVIDGVCGKLGKSLGSIIGTCFVSLSKNNDIRDTSGAFAVTTMVLCAIWFYSVIYLSAIYYKSIDNQKGININKGEK